jgi:2-polyprenyl-6-methoxyphenol hydroxylase-like FAD-dependent oxidoreductase
MMRHSACLGCENAQHFALTTQISRLTFPTSVIHRHDYHSILLDEATRLGTEIVLGQHITKVDVSRDRVMTADGTEWAGDVIIGADGAVSLFPCFKRSVLKRVEAKPTFPMN